MIFVQLYFFAAFISQSTAWLNVGHKTIGAIASQLMKNNHSINQIQNVMTYLDAISNDEAHGYNPLKREKGFIRPKLESNILADANWPDVNKFYYNVNIFDSWHFINKKYDPEGLDVNNTGCNITSTINSVTQSTQIVRDITKTEPQTAHWFAHFGLNYLTHIIGDMHQPFHNIGHCIIWEGGLTQDYGGNLWPVYLADGTREKMHIFWDSGAMKWGPEKEYKLSIQDPEYENWAADLLERYPVQALKDSGYNVDFEGPKNYKNFSSFVEEWVDEGYDIAVETYKNVPKGGTINETYAEEIYLICEKRVVLAGYRLAALLDGIFSRTTYPPFERKVEKKTTISHLYNALYSFMGYDM